MKKNTQKNRNREIKPNYKKQIEILEKAVEYTNGKNENLIAELKNNKIIYNANLEKEKKQQNIYQYLSAGLFIALSISLIYIKNILSGS